MANARLRKMVEANPGRFAGRRYARLRKALGVEDTTGAAISTVDPYETGEARAREISEPLPDEPYGPGSKPVKATKAELAEEYERLTGEPPNSRWLKAELEDEVEQARSRYRRHEG